MPSAGHYAQASGQPQEQATMQSAELPTRPDSEGIAQAIETWKRYFDPNLPGGQASLDDFTAATDKIVAACDLGILPIDAEPLALFKEIVLEGLRNAQPWYQTQEGRLAHSVADGLCNRIKTWLQSEVASSKMRGKRRGRKPCTDANADKRIASAWKSGHHRRYKELGRQFDMSGSDVRRAIDRYRKRCKDS
jgi:hypothetical protein